MKTFKTFIKEDISMGININDSRASWTELILSGKKTIETRETDSLKPYVGKRVAIIQTGKGKAKIVGAMTIGQPIIYHTIDEFKADVNKHRVDPETGFGEIKYGYPLTDVQRVENPIEVNSKGIVARNVKGLI